MMWNNLGIYYILPHCETDLGARNLMPLLWTVSHQGAQKDRIFQESDQEFSND